jgi:hypothetical protein
MREKIPECHRFHRWSCHRHSGHNLESSQTCGFRIQCLQETRLWQFHWFAPLFRLVNMVLKGGHGWSLVYLRNVCSYFSIGTSITSSLGRYVFGSEISYNKAPPRLPGLGC